MLTRAGKSREKLRAARIFFFAGCRTLCWRYSPQAPDLNAQITGVAARFHFAGVCGVEHLRCYIPFKAGCVGNFGYRGPLVARGNEILSDTLPMGLMALLRGAAGIGRQERHGSNGAAYLARKDKIVGK